MPSDLQVSNIKDQANANSAITIASDGQITVNQNNPTVTLGSNTTFPDGHIIQVESNWNADYFDFDDSNWKLLEHTELTNVKDSSNILIHATCNLRLYASDGNAGIAIRLYRNVSQGTHGANTTGTELVSHSGNENSMIFVYINQIANELYSPTSFTFLDTAPPSGTVSYGTVGQSYTGSVDSQHDGLNSITAMEIAR